MQNEPPPGFSCRLCGTSDPWPSRGVPPCSQGGLRWPNKDDAEGTLEKVALLIYWCYKLNWVSLPAGKLIH